VVYINDAANGGAHMFAVVVPEDDDRRARDINVLLEASVPALKF
jgi:hypothetical protein